MDVPFGRMGLWSHWDGEHYVALAAGGPFLGPLKVTAEAEGRSLGAWNVSPASSAAFFARREAGPCVIRWQMPGGEPQRKEVILEDRPVWFSIK